ncbi:MAG: ABC transporter permease [Dethiobacteria bacterium]|jgi:ABC-2 type transport system permease protein|nr:ABC transporter permease [Bacillota bacterium]HOP69313.1 ABC transporter permease [Bacillota bacterium]HPT34341.1 ABC transporter permease [Bacillota bacterium]
MSHVLWIALNHLKLLSRDRAAYILLLALPLALTLVIGLALGGISGSGEEAKAALAVADLDQSGLSRYLAAALETEAIRVEHCPEGEARERVDSGEAAAALIIPPGFEESLRRGAPLPVTMVRGERQDPSGLAEERLRGVLNRLRANAAAAALGEAAGRGNWEEIFYRADEKWRSSPAVKVVQERVDGASQREIPTGHRQTSPGFVVMFGMMTVVAAGGTSLLQEKQAGTLARLLAAPLTYFQLLSGKALGLWSSGLVQMAVLIAAGRLLFQVEWGRDLPALALLAAAFSFASTGLGLLLASLCRTQGQAQAVGTLSVILISMLGGAWWPVEILPGFMQSLAKAFPSYWAMQGFVDLILRQAGLAQVAPAILVLSAFGLVFLSLGVLLFRRRQ